MPASRRHRTRTRVRILGAALACALGVALAPIAVAAAAAATGASTGQHAGHRPSVAAKIADVGQQTLRVQEQPGVPADEPPVGVPIRTTTTPDDADAANSRTAAASPARGPPVQALRQA